MKDIVSTSLRTLDDSRGEFIEVFRDSWATEKPVQWNYVRSKAHVLRGFHVHVAHTDHLILVEGMMYLGLCDMRKESSNFMKSEILPLKAEEPKLITIPPGIAHCFYYPVKAILINAVDKYWSNNDELGCMWNDPAFGLKWPLLNDEEPILSKRDTSASSFDSLLIELNERRANR
ncbi:MAG: dTDP-4-dehydrorhamnose 3,5-epimerase [Saprospiraceae bacterium]